MELFSIQRFTRFARLFNIFYVDKCGCFGGIFSADAHVCIYQRRDMSDLLVRPEIIRNRIENSGYEYPSFVACKLAQGWRHDTAGICGMMPLLFVMALMLGRLDTMFTLKMIFTVVPGRLDGESDRAPPIPLPRADGRRLCNIPLIREAVSIRTDASRYIAESDIRTKP